MTDKEFIALVVREFYKKATTDVMIGYHFRHIQDFSTHFPRIEAFWQLQLFGKTDVPLNPPLDAIRAHVPLKIHKGEVGRWVLLFEQTLDELTAQAPTELTERWREKVRHFQQIFWQNQLLFPKA